MFGWTVSYGSALPRNQTSLGGQPAWSWARCLGAAVRSHVQNFPSCFPWFLWTGQINHSTCQLIELSKSFLFKPLSKEQRRCSQQDPSPTSPLHPSASSAPLLYSPKQMDHGLCHVPWCWACPTWFPIMPHLLKGLLCFWEQIELAWYQATPGCWPGGVPSQGPDSCFSGNKKLKRISPHFSKINKLVIFHRKCWIFYFYSEAGLFFSKTRTSIGTNTTKFSVFF